MKLNANTFPLGDDATGERLISVHEAERWFWLYETWRFRHTNHASPIITFGWRFELPNGELSTDVRHRVLLESFKCVVWGQISNNAYGKTLSVGTLPSMASGVRELFTWMVWKDISNFEELDAERIEEYVKSLPNLIVDREGFYRAKGWRNNVLSLFVDSEEGERITMQGLDSENVPGAFDDEDDGISYAQVSYRILILYYAHAQRGLLRGNLLPILMHSPFKGRPSGEIVQQIAAFVVNRIPPLPEAVCLPLLSEVVTWIEVYGNPLVGIVQRYMEYRRNHIGTGLTSMLQSIGDELDDAVPPLSARRAFPWREPRVADVAPLSEQVESIHHRVRLAVLFFRDAVVLAVLYLCGLRISEVCSVELLPDQGGELPSCVEKRSSADGLLDLYFLSGITTKGRNRPAQTQWVVGCTPQGETELPLVVRALEILSRLDSCLIPSKEPYQLFRTFANPQGFTLDPDMFVPADGTSLSRSSKRFIRCFVDLSMLPDFDSNQVDLRSYRESLGGCIRTHQGRKTFATYCLSTQNSAIPAVSHHFKHLTESITQAAYYPAALRMKSELEEMRFSGTVDYFVQATLGTRVYGKMATAVDSFIRDNGLQEITDIAELRAKIEGIVVDHDLRIFFSGHGNCFISAAPMASRCRESSGTISWVNVAPDYASRSVSMCAGCDCYAYDSSHREFWQKRVDETRLAASDPANRVALLRHAQSKKILFIMDGAI